MVPYSADFQVLSFPHVRVGESVVGATVVGDLVGVLVGEPVGIMVGESVPLDGDAVGAGEGGSGVGGHSTLQSAMALVTHSLSHCTSVQWGSIWPTQKPTAELESCSQPAVRCGSQHEEYSHVTGLQLPPGVHMVSGPQTP